MDAVRAVRRFLRRRVLRRADLADLVERGPRIGEGASVDPDVLLDVDFCWLISLGRRCTIAPRVLVLAHDASTRRGIGYTRVGRVHIGDDTFIGAGTVILPGVTIGDGAIVGAGSVVRRDVPAGVVVVGNPAVVQGQVAEHLSRQRDRLRTVPVHGGPGLRWRAGLASATNRQIARELEHHRTVFVE